jgi:riboflavin kinase/FMN adenylyltransferase
MKHNRPPLAGIFVVDVLGIEGAPRQGVASLGVRPTVKVNGPPVLEVHLFDFAGDLYGRHLQVRFLSKLRDEVKYADLESLKAQIARDAADARAFFRGDGPAKIEQAVSVPAVPDTSTSQRLNG